MRMPVLLSVRSPVAQAAGERLGMQVNAQSVVTKERIRKEPLSCKSCLHPPGLPVDANLVVVHCSLTFLGIAVARLAPLSPSGA